MAGLVPGKGMDSRNVNGAIANSSLTSSNDVVNHEHLLAGLHGALLHLEKVGSVFLLVGGRHAGTGHLALLADGHEARIETQSERRPKEETPRVQPHHDIGLLVELEALELEGAQQGEVGGGGLEERQDVDEVDAGDREIGEVTKRAEQSYLCTGEFGGTGGGGGGLSSRGIVGGQNGGFDCGQRGLVFAGRRQRLGSVGGSAHVGEERRERGEGGTISLSLKSGRNCSQQGVQHGIAWASAVERDKRANWTPCHQICQRAKKETGT